MCKPLQAKIEFTEADIPQEGFVLTYPLTNRIQLEFPFPQSAPKLLQFFDGDHTVEEIVDELVFQGVADRNLVKSDLTMLMTSLQGMGKLAILEQKVHRVTGKLNHYENTPFGSCRWYGDTG